MKNSWSVEKLGEAAQKELQELELLKQSVCTKLFKKNRDKKTVIGVLSSTCGRGLV